VRAAGKTAKLPSMGQEIGDAEFSDEAFAEFARRVAAETELLTAWERDGLLAEVDYRLGFELEGWLVDRDYLPAPRNLEFLERVQDPDVVPELARFNFEINDDPLDFSAGMFDHMHRSLLARWQRCEAAAHELDMQALSIGILPTVTRRDLSLGNISPLSRYHALNEQVFRLRNGQPIELYIEGAQALRTLHDDVMLESAATSLQIHLQVSSHEVVRAFNAAKILSAPMVAIGANSPFFLERQLWAETRIPLFEQAVGVGGSDYSKRVTFGIRYAQQSILECFEANRDRYPVLLPDLMDVAQEELAHLRLHNGTIWRWNRPLIGFDAQARPHYRVEHRVVAAGTSANDLVANTAFFVGLVLSLLGMPEAAEKRLPFATARDNFYRAAEHGLEARVQWLHGAPGRLGDLILEQLLPLAAMGLQRIRVPADEARRWLSIVEQRVRSGRTGSAWQVAWIDKFGPNWPGLVQAYSAQQEEGRPVHEWELS